MGCLALVSTLYGCLCISYRRFRRWRPRQPRLNPRTQNATLLNWLSKSRHTAWSTIKAIPLAVTSCVTILLVVLVFDELTHSPVTMRPLAVPQSLIDQGLSGAVLVRKVIDEVLTIVHDQTLTLADDLPNLQFSEDDIDLDVSGGFSIKQVARFLRNSLHGSSLGKAINVQPERVIVGDITATLNTTGTLSYQLTLNMIGGFNTVVKTERLDSLEMLLPASGEALLKLVDPGRLINIYAIRGQTDSAEELIDEVSRWILRASPSVQPRLHWQLALVNYIYEDNRYSRLGFAEQMMSLDNSSARSHFAYAYALENVGEIDEALEQYALAIEIDPAYAATVYSNIASIYADRNYIYTNDDVDVNALALEYFEKALELDPYHYPARLGIIEMLFDMDDNDRLQHHVVTAANLYTHDFDVLMYQADLIERQYYKPDQLKYLDAALEIKSDDINALGRRVQVCIELEKYDIALRDLEKLKELDPQPEHFQRSAWLQHLSGLHLKAIETYRQGIDLFPYDRDLPELLEWELERHDMERDLNIIE